MEMLILLNSLFPTPQYSADWPGMGKKYEAKFKILNIF